MPLLKLSRVLSLCREQFTNVHEIGIPMRLRCVCVCVRVCVPWSHTFHISLYHVHLMWVPGKLSQVRDELDVTPERALPCQGWLETSP